MKCISDRIQNYLESYIDKLKNGYEYDEEEKEYVRDEDGKIETYWDDYRKRKIKFKFIIRYRRLPFIIDGGDNFKKQIMDFYFENVRGELEYTNKNPKTVAVSILYSFLRPHRDFHIRELLLVSGIATEATIKKLFKPSSSSSNLKLDYVYPSEDYKRKQPLYCVLSESYWDWVKYGRGSYDW